MTWIAGNTVIRTARRDWSCVCRVGDIHGRGEDGYGAQCARAIPKGIRYVESLDSVASYQSGARMCWECATTHQALITASQPWQHVRCRIPYIDQLRSDPRACECGGERDSWYSPIGEDARVPVA